MRGRAVAMIEVSRALRFGGFAAFAAAGLRVLGFHTPLAPLTAAGVLALTAAKFLQEPSRADTRPAALPRSPAALSSALLRLIPTILAFLRRADDSLEDHARLEVSVGSGSRRAFFDWASSGLRAAVYWLPVCLLAMAAGAAAVSPLKLVSGGLGLADSEEGRWLLSQSWPRLLGKVLSAQLLAQVYLLAAFWGLRGVVERLGLARRDATLAAAATVCACHLSLLLAGGHESMKAAPLTAIEAALLYAYARTGSMVVPCTAGFLLGLASLYSARMVVLLKADLGSIDALAGIPGLGGVLTAAGWALFLSAVLRGSSSFGRERSGSALLPRGLLWGVGLYLASYLSYYAVYALAPAGETVPPILKQTLLMPFDMLIYIFLIGAALEEVIFRYGLFGALLARIPSKDPAVRFWTAALVSSAVFSGFHFVDLSALVRFLGVNVSTFVQSLMMVYGFSWPGFIGRIAAGLVLASLYQRSGVLPLCILAHFTSNLLEAIGLRWGLPWLLAAVSGILVLDSARMARKADPAP